VRKRSFLRNESILHEWRQKSLVKDLAVNRSAFDRIVAAGGFISVPAGSAPDGNANPGAQSRPRKRPWTRPPASDAGRV